MVVRAESLENILIAPGGADEYGIFEGENPEGQEITLADGTKITLHITPPDINEVKARKSCLIISAFETAISEPVVITGVAYYGGFDSAIKLKGALDLAQLSQQTTVTFFDVDRAGHELSIADAVTVVTTIGGDYQTKFTKKQALLTAITTATTQADVDNIVW